MGRSSAHKYIFFFCIQTQNLIKNNITHSFFFSCKQKRSICFHLYNIISVTQYFVLLYVARFCRFDISKKHFVSFVYFYIYLSILKIFQIFYKNSNKEIFSLWMKISLTLYTVQYFSKLNWFRNSMWLFAVFISIGHNENEE